jgi:fermentation-respiration switch protein FrsA (DUF1100 family)
MHKKSILILSCCLLAGYAGIVSIFFFTQTGMVYSPAKVVSGSPAAAKLKYEDVNITAKDGVTLAGWFIKRENSERAVIFFHGNAGNIASSISAAKTYHDLGFSVLTFDYRGFGKSQGVPGEEGTYLDAQAAWDYMTGEKKYKPDDIVLVGRSLGGSIAAWLAAHNKPGALIIESSFASMRKLGSQTYPYIPIGLICKFKYDTEKYLKSVNCPVLVIHSKNDELVPFSHGLRLYEAANQPKDFLEIAGPHNLGYSLSENKYMAGLKAFLDPDRDVGSK